MGYQKMNNGTQIYLHRKHEQYIGLKYLQKNKTHTYDTPDKKIDINKKS